MGKFKNKYRIPSARLQNWNYTSSGMYFITICTDDRRHFFGENKFNFNHGCRDAMHGVSISYKNKFGPQSKNIGSINRGFKSSITSYAQKNNLKFGCQERFHDRIIRSYDEYVRISEYIKNNPLNGKG